MTLGQRIQAGRTALELSQEALGERLGVSRQAVSKWEADAAVPDTDKLIALSRLFGLTLNQLLAVDIEADSDGYISPAQDVGPHDPMRPKPRPRREGARSLLTALLTLALLLSWAVLFRLDRRVALLEEKMAAIPSPEAWENPGVADFTYSMSSPRGEKELFFDFDLIPEKPVEGARAYFLVTCADYLREVDIEARLEGGHYRAAGSITTPWTAEPPITVEVVYTNGEGTPYTVPLVRVDRGAAGNVVKYLWKEGEPSEEEPPVAQVGFSFTGEVLELDMRPGPAMEDWDVTFWAAGAGTEDASAPGKKTEGLWTGELDLSGVEAPCTVTARFTRGTEERTVPLLRLDSWADGNVKYEYLYRK